MKNHRKKDEFGKRSERPRLPGGTSTLPLALGLLLVLPAMVGAEGRGFSCSEVRGRALLKNVEDQIACHNHNAAGTSAEKKCLSRADSRFQRRWDSGKAEIACPSGPSDAAREAMAFADVLAGEIPEIPGIVGGPIDPPVLEPRPEPDPRPDVEAEGPAGLRVFYMPFCEEGQNWRHGCGQTYTMRALWPGPWASSADWACQNAARRLPGFNEAERPQFKAWLGRSHWYMNPNGSVLNGRPPTGFLAEGLVDANRPIVLPSGTLVANNWADLVDGRIRHPINESSDGARVGPRYVITGAGTDGRPAGEGVDDFCNRYRNMCNGNDACLPPDDGDPEGTVMIGKTTARGRGWTAAARVECSPVAESSIWQNAGLYCFEVTNTRVHKEVYSSFPFLDVEPSLLD